MVAVTLVCAPAPRTVFEEVLTLPSGTTVEDAVRASGLPARFASLDWRALTAGIWIERADTFRQQSDVDLVTGAPNYVEKTVKLPNGQANPIGAPANVKFNQNSGFNHTEEFVELELRPLPGLTITPGYKHVDFNIEINATYNQTTRIPQTISQTYTKDLPFATINYAITPRLSVYGQYAQGMAVPILGDLYVNNPSLSSIQPQTSTNYQAGAVYHGERLSLDADVYVININNKIQQETVFDDTNTAQTAYFNEGRVLYKGVEGQVTYALPRGFAVFANGSINYAKEAGTHNQVSNSPKSTAAAGLLYKHGPIHFSLVDKWTGPQYATSEALDPTQTFFIISRSVRISPYNTTILAASYQWHQFRFGLNVTDLFNSEKIENLGLSGNGPSGNLMHGLNQTADQLYYQPGRQITGDITVKF